MDGILIINKPEGLTSHDVVARIRRKLGIRRVGHAGTLDPLATGVLVVLVGRSTKLFDKFVNFDKAYEATLRLGLVTDTADIKGRILAENPVGEISQKEVEKVMQKFIGEIEQVPPMYSAVKVNGKRLYKLARKGIQIRRSPRRVFVKEFRLLDMNLPDIHFHLECSKGTYVRKLAEDVGEELGCGGCIVQINRTRIGPFSINEAIPLEEVHEGHLQTFQALRST